MVTIINKAIHLEHFQRGQTWQHTICGTLIAKLKPANIKGILDVE